MKIPGRLIKSVLRKRLIVERIMSTGLLRWMILIFQIFPPPGGAAHGVGRRVPAGPLVQRPARLRGQDGLPGPGLRRDHGERRLA